MRNRLVPGLLLACLASGQSPNDNSSDSISVIVRFKQGANTSSRQTLSKRGAQHKTELPLIGASVFELTLDEYQRLATDPNVELLAPDMPVSATGFSGTLDYGWVTAFGQTNPTGYSNSYTGKGVGVAVIDSGVRQVHADLD